MALSTSDTAANAAASLSFDSTLSRLDDSVIFHMIERAEFPLNKSIYELGALEMPESSMSFLDWYLSEHERLKSLASRHKIANEHTTESKDIPCFLNDFKTPFLDVRDINDTIKQFYLDILVPKLCSTNTRKGYTISSTTFGFTVTCDISCLHALFRRIHYGAIVAERRFLLNTAKYAPLVAKQDRGEITQSIVDANEDEKTLRCIKLKAETYLQCRFHGKATQDPSYEAVDDFVEAYRDLVIPLTREVEVEYLMQRHKY